MNTLPVWIKQEVQKVVQDISCDDFLLKTIEKLGTFINAVRIDIAI